MPWTVRAVPLPDGDQPADLWVDAAGCLAADPVPDAELLPGRYVVPGLVDAHAHPAVGMDAGLPVARSPAEASAVLARWAESGVCLVRDTGSPGGLVLQLDITAGMPSVQAAGRFLAPPGRYFPALLPEGVPEEQLTELALGELARGARWVKVIADFPPVVDGRPAGPAALTYSRDAVATMVAAVHAAGGRVAAHATTDAVADLVRAGVDSVEHGVAIDEPALRLMAQTGAAWTPTLCAVLRLPDDAPDAVRRRNAEHRERLRELLPLARRLGVPVLAGTDSAGTIAREVALLAENGLEPAEALAAATTTGYRVLGESHGQPGQPATLVTYQDDPRQDLAVLSSPAAILINGVRVR
ncbi:MAG TPA: amidohydrolase family protein [Streptosporangiaceae bacterium]|nr:amidohydrolase family protein [Streptosporangiaceae bacterium]